MGGSSGGGDNGGGGMAGSRQYQMLMDQWQTADEMRNLSKDPSLVNMSQGQLSPEEYKWMNAQQNAIAAGNLNARNDVVNTSREQSSARGLYSSAGAIADEAGQLGALDQTYAGQSAGIYGQMADLSRSGMLQGFGLRSSLLSSAGGLYGAGGSGMGGLGSLNLQRQQYGNSYGQQQQGMMSSNIMGAGNLISGFFK